MTLKGSKDPMGPVLKTQSLTWTCWCNVIFFTRGVSNRALNAGRKEVARGGEGREEVSLVRFSPVNVSSSLDRASFDSSSSLTPHPPRLYWTMCRLPPIDFTVRWSATCVSSVWWPARLTWARVKSRLSVNRGWPLFSGSSAVPSDGCFVILVLGTWISDARLVESRGPRWPWRSVFVELPALLPVTHRLTRAAVKMKRKTRRRWKSFFLLVWAAKLQPKNISAHSGGGGGGGAVMGRRRRFWRTPWG